VSFNVDPGKKNEGGSYWRSVRERGKGERRRGDALSISKQKKTLYESAWVGGGGLSGCGGRGVGRVWGCLQTGQIALPSKRKTFRLLLQTTVLAI